MTFTRTVLLALYLCVFVACGDSSSLGEFRAQCSETQACAEGLDCQNSVCVGSVVISGAVVSAQGNVPDNELHVALFRLPDARTYLPVAKTLVETVLPPPIDFPTSYTLSDLAEGSFCVVAYIRLFEPADMAFRGDSCFTIDPIGPVSLTDGTRYDRIDVVIAGQSPIVD